MSGRRDVMGEIGVEKMGEGVGRERKVVGNWIYLGGDGDWEMEPREFEGRAIVLRQ
jgi:hypothetical protein